MIYVNYCFNEFLEKDCTKRNGRIRLKKYFINCVMIIIRECQCQKKNIHKHNHLNLSADLAFKVKVNYLISHIVNLIRNV